MYEFDHLITERMIDKQTDLDTVVREVTEYTLTAVGEEALKAVKKGDVIQFQRRGFFICDSVDPVPPPPCIYFLRGLFILPSSQVPCGALEGAT